jgi:tetratricopeptide (TPR) repeat protein
MLPEVPHYQAHLQRGALLRQNRRYQEAYAALIRAIEIDPEKAIAYAELALTFNDWKLHEQKALQAIDRAIALEPHNADFFGFKGWILVCQHKYRTALQAAKQGLELNPISVPALNTEANAFTKLGRWREAEAAARRILAIQAQNLAGLNLLAQALRFQGRRKESHETVEQVLALLPNDSFGHMTAGYGAMEVGDHVRAGEHFLTALRMDPHCSLAQQGLLHSLRGRVWIYRLQFRLTTILRQPATFRRAVILMIIVIGIIPAAFFLDSLHHGLGSLIALAWMAYIYLSFFSRPTGDIFLFLDPMGRHALSRRHKVEACFFAAVLIIALVLTAYHHIWIVFVPLVAYLSVFAFSIYYPLLTGRKELQNQRETT